MTTSIFSLPLHLKGHLSEGEVYAETPDKFVKVLGNFRKLKEAKACMEQNDGSEITAYLNCEYKVGWVVYSPVAKEDLC